jgi:hypothetical protein
LLERLCIFESAIGATRSVIERATGRNALIADLLQKLTRPAAVTTCEKPICQFHFKTPVVESTIETMTAAQQSTK